VISFDSVAKSFAGRRLFEDVSLTIAPGDRVGIVGPNGAGKTTLLSLITGREHPDAGSVAVARGLAVGHLSQETVPVGEATVLETALRSSGRLAAIESDLESIPHALTVAEDDPERERLATRLAEAHALYQELGGNERRARAQRILAGLGFSAERQERKLSTLSGGYVMRAELARLLVERPDVLLLDEPTNHLDLESVLWLEGFLQSYPGTLVVVSHDRDFLNATIGSVLEVEGCRVTRYAGNYDVYARERVARREQLEAAARNQERRIRETERFIERFRAKATKATQVQSRIKALAREERIVVAPARRTVRFHFPQPERTSEVAIELAGVAKAYGPIQVYQSLDFILRRGEKTVLVGPNGAGKSTLLRLLAGATGPDRGERRIGLRVETGYYTQHRQDMLDLDKTVLENAFEVARHRGETFVRTLLGAFLFRDDDVKKKASVLSGGEKSRLALARLLLDPPSVLLMDEPTIHLDIDSVDALIAALEEFTGALCFVSHDVHFIRSIARRVVRIEAGALTDYGGDWDYYLWKRGIARPGAPGAPPSARGLAEAAGESPEKSDLPRAPASRAAGGNGSATPARGRQRASREARSELARRTRELQRALAAVESEVDALERAKAEVEAALADPASYANGAAEIADLRRRQGDLERRLAEKLERWADLGAVLEKEHPRS